MFNLSLKYLSRSLLWATLLLSFALQLHDLAEESLWGDEIFTAIFSALSPLDTIRFTAKDIHPPLYYLLVGRLPHLPFWPIAPPSMVTDWFWRWPSVLATVLTASITYRLTHLLIARRFTDEHPCSTLSLFATLLFALSPIVLKYGQEARMHALFMLLSAFSTLCLALALQDQKCRRRYWVAYALTSILNLYTMYFSFLILAAQGTWGLIHSLQAQNKLQPSAAMKQPIIVKFQRSVIIPFAIATATALLAYLPWWPVLWRLLSLRAQVGAIEGGIGSPLAFLLNAIQAIGPYGSGAWLFFSLYWVGVFSQGRQNKGVVGFGILWIVLPLILPIILGDSRALQLRYAFILPVYLVFVAGAVGWLIAKLSDRLILPVPTPSITRFWVCGILLALISTLSLRDIYQPGKPNWREAAAFVAQQAGPKDVIVTGPLWDDGRFFQYYYPYPKAVMPPPTFVRQLPHIAAEMAAVQGRLWLVTRQNPGGYDNFRPHPFYGVTVLEQMQLEYDPVRLIETVAELCKKAARQADDWASDMAVGGVLTPDPRPAAAAGYRCQGDTYLAVGYHEDALKAYRRAIKAFPAWAGGQALLAKTYLAVDNLPASTEAFAQAVALNPSWQGPLADQAAKLAQQGQLSEAIVIYQKIIP